MGKSYKSVFRGWFLGRDTWERHTNRFFGFWFCLFVLFLFCFWFVFGLFLVCFVLISINIFILVFSQVFFLCFPWVFFFSFFYFLFSSFSVLIFFLWKRPVQKTSRGKSFQKKKKKEIKHQKISHKRQEI